MFANPSENIDKLSETYPSTFPTATTVRCSPFLIHGVSTFDATHHVPVCSAFNRAASISRSSWRRVPSPVILDSLVAQSPEAHAGDLAPAITSTSQTGDSGATPSQICLTLFRCVSSLSSSDLSRSASRVLFSRSRALFLTPCIRGARSEPFS